MRPSQSHDQTKAFHNFSSISSAGLSQALQPGLEYTYRYEARVASAVLQVQRQYAAAGANANVHIQMTNDNIALVKVILFGSYTSPLETNQQLRGLFSYL